MPDGGMIGEAVGLQKLVVIRLFPVTSTPSTDKPALNPGTMLPPLMIMSPASRPLTPKVCAAQVLGATAAGVSWPVMMVWRLKGCPPLVLKGLAAAGRLLARP